MEISATCEDPLFHSKNFVIDAITEVEKPAPHQKVSAHFNATETTLRFDVTFYFPRADKWAGRFFQHAYPLEQPENQNDIEFALTNGGYLVNVKGVPNASGGYRVDAAAAKLAKEYAARLYGKSDQIYGYLWGGSGGSLQTIGALENTTGIWHGYIPYVMATETSLVNVNAIGSLAGLALKDKAPQINEAIAKGGSGFENLTSEEREIFEESLGLGMPRRVYEFAQYNGFLLMFLSGGVKFNDPTYVEDFWSKPGYEGANPPGFLSAAKTDQFIEIVSVVADGNGKPQSIQLAEAPKFGSLGGLGVELWLYPSDGKQKLGTLSGELKESVVTLQENDPALLKQLKEGAKLRVNNLFFLAMHFYHRHALPLGPDHQEYDRFRNKDGTPKFPQREYRASHAQVLHTSGGATQTGKIRGKAIVLQSMVDGGALPVVADWYSRQVRKAIGEVEHKNSFRLWYNDNAGHFDSPPQPLMLGATINYVPTIYQSLQDLVAWVEKGIEPPASTGYSVRDGQVELALNADERNGIQPVVTLTVDGSKQIEVAANQAVEFRGRIEVPPGAGKVVGTGWFFGEGAPRYEIDRIDEPKQKVELRKTHTYAKPGVYYATLFAVSHRHGDTSPALTSIQNLDRVRIVVR